jgi:pimeloyl-ACP methyl ester carboxylesterase
MSDLYDLIRTKRRRAYCAMAAAIPGARFELIEGAGHIVNYEAADVLARCVGFL